MKSKTLSSGVVSYECELRRHSKQCKLGSKSVKMIRMSNVSTTTTVLLMLVVQKQKIRQSIKLSAVDYEETAEQVHTQELQDVSDSRCFLDTSLDWLCDGTFIVVPGALHQLFTIHALINNHLVPCVYGLLPNKQEVTYKYLALLRGFRGLNPELQP